MTCAGPGRAWTEADGDGAPTRGGCGHRYTRITRTAPVTAAVAVDWTVTWQGSGGTSGHPPGDADLDRDIPSRPTDPGGDPMTAPTVGVPGRPPAPSRARPGEPVRTPLPTRQRRPGWLALATALIVAFAALGAYLYGQAGAKTPVVVVVAEVPAGHVIERSDLSTVAVAGAVTAVAAGNLDSVVGRTATVHLLPDMLLQRSMVSDAPALAPAEAAVGVAVTSGQIPADGLRPGDVVEVLALPDETLAAAAAGQASRAEVLVSAARIDASREDPAQTGGTLLTLIVPRAKAAAVAAASGAGRIALVEVAP